MYRAEPGEKVRRDTHISGGGIWLLLTIGLLYAGYFVLRYGGLWTESDTAAFSRLTEQMVQSGNALSGPQYAHGFGYQAWLGSLSLLTGLSVPVLNTVVMPYVGMLLLVLPAFLAYRALTGSERGGLVAVGILFTIPDLMFTVLRGNHEKLNIAFMLAAIYVLLQGFRAMGRGRPIALATWVLLFYALVFANATVNDYFASTFVLAATLTVPGGYLLMRRGSWFESQQPAVARLTMTVAISWLLVWWVMLFVFPAAGKDFRLLSGTLDKLRHLFLFLDISSNPYAQSQWRTPAISTVLGASRWLLIGASLVAWVSQLWRVVVRGTRLSIWQLLLLALYGTFAMIVIISVPVDLVGSYAGSNLELRNFTDFCLLAAPVLAWRAVPPAPLGRILSRRSAACVALVMLSAFTLIGLAKSTVDPAVSRLWISYTPAERQAVAAFRHDELKPAPWAGANDRLLFAGLTWYQYIQTGSQGIVPAALSLDQDWIGSPQVTANAALWRERLPSQSSQDRVYDNGGAQIYRPVANALPQRMVDHDATRLTWVPR